MNKAILNTGIQSFIKNNLNTDTLSVLLKKPLFDQVSNHELVQQIESAKKAKDKLPTWFNTPRIYFPKKLHIAQTSSELTAAYKSSLIVAKVIADLSGGLGVDTYYFAKHAIHIDHFELHKELAEIATHNFKVLHATNIDTYNEDGVAYVLSHSKSYDMIYIDPDRRDQHKKRVFLLSDCSPDVPKHLESLFKHTQQLFIKTSPLLDISQGMKELSNVKQIIALGVKNELKELLWILDKNYTGIPILKAVNLATEQQEYHCPLDREESAIASIGPIEDYLYEPNVALLKSGMFKSIAQDYQLHKLHPNTHLYTSNELKEFPGRRFKVLREMHYNKKNLKSLENTKANISCRNFKSSVALIRKKHRIKDGGAHYLFFTTNSKNEAVVVQTEKI